jgi:IS5 family transposase
MKPIEKEASAMLNLDSRPADALIRPGDSDRLLYEQIVPEDHFLRRLLQAVDFESFRPVLTSAYSPDQGRPPLDPVILLKLEVLARQYRLSDREVVAEARFNIAFRFFLGLSLMSPLPHHTSMTYFRHRLTAQRLQEIFDALVGHARRLGLVKDRLRLKDATHILANIAIPSTIRLVAEARDRLLETLLPFAPQRVSEEQQHAEAIRVGTEDAKDEERLLQRVTHLRAVLSWADDVPGQDVFRQQCAQAQEQLQAALALAHKILADRENPKAGDKVLSVHDPDARRGMHGGYYEGYQLDIAMDADSEIITAVNVLPANGDEGADAAHLIRQEEQAHGNDVEALSIDGAGYRGTVLRELTDPAGLNLEVFTPPSALPAPKGFPAERFTLTVINGRETMTCPAGQTTQSRDRNDRGTGYRYRFSKAQCSGCALRHECLGQPNAQRRVVTTNDYEAEYAAADAKAKTPEYAEVRRRHPAIERKLAELVRRHDMRHARYRGQLRVLYQGVLTSLVVNLKRIVRLLFAPEKVAAGRGTVRAALVTEG